MDQPQTGPDDAGLTVASGPMPREMAHWYMDLTDGQFEARQHANGRWYLYTPQPAEVSGTAAVPSGRVPPKDQTR